MKLSKSDIKIEDVTKSSVIRKSLTGLALISGLTMTSCSDDKTCTDFDTGADPYAGSATDSDFGVADPSGSGSRCADFD